MNYTIRVNGLECRCSATYNATMIVTECRSTKSYTVTQMPVITCRFHVLRYLILTNPTIIFQRLFFGRYVSDKAVNQHSSASNPLRVLWDKPLQAALEILQLLIRHILHTLRMALL